MKSIKIYTVPCKQVGVEVRFGTAPKHENLLHVYQTRSFEELGLNECLQTYPTILNEFTAWITYYLAPHSKRGTKPPIRTKGKPYPKLYSELSKEAKKIAKKIRKDHWELILSARGLHKPQSKKAS